MNAPSPREPGIRGPLRLLSVAPMMDRTDRHYRFLVRQISNKTLLYTKMITTAAILHGDREPLIGFDEAEKPLVLQLGGEDAQQLAECARIAADRGYDEINLNVGCPSDRVQKGRFGVRLMAEPQRVADAVAAMRAAVELPVTVKHRIGIDDLDRYEDMANFVRTVAAAGCDRFSVHARKAWLEGLSPKQNRTVPPLRYVDVHRLKREFPELRIEINGGFKGLREVKEQLRHVDGVMIGRAAYDDPFMLAGADAEIFRERTEPPSRREVIEAMIPYIRGRLEEGCPLRRVTRHMIGLLAGQPGARAWRRLLSENAHEPGAGVEVIREAMSKVPELDARPGAVARNR